MKSKVLLSRVAICLALAGCAVSSTGGEGQTGGSGDEGTGSGGSSSSGGTRGTGGSVGSGGATGTGGASATGGRSGTGGMTGTGGLPGTGGTFGTGGVTGSGGATGTGGVTGTGGAKATGGATGTGGTKGTGGASGTGGSTGTGGSMTVDCSATMPSGGNTYTGSNVNGTADGLGYGIWSNGSGGSITVFPNAHAFSASWNNGGDFLAHVGLDFNATKSYTAYGTIAAQYVENKTGTAGGYSSIGMYGWTHSPCVEWYINDDSYNGLGKGNATAQIDGATYYLTSNSTTGSGGNACEAGHTGPWTQIWSYRQTARTCGTITVSDHFAAWVKQGWQLGTLASVHINVEVGGGTGSIQFPVANVTTTSN